jgi:chromosome segregation ATPase
MPELTEDERAKVETLKQSLGDLRYRVSKFQDNIESYLNAVDEIWRDVKSRLSIVEARLAGMEARISAIPANVEWRIEDLDEMLKDLGDVGDEIDKMRQRFFSFAEGTLERVN